MLQSIGSNSFGTLAHCQSGSLVQSLAEAGGKVEAGEALVDDVAGDGAAALEEAGEALVNDDAGDAAATADLEEVDDMVLFEASW